MRKYITAEVHTQSAVYILDECDSAFYDKETDSIRIIKSTDGYITMMIPYREVIAFKTTLKFEE